MHDFHFTFYTTFECLSNLGEKEEISKMAAIQACNPNI